MEVNMAKVLNMGTDSVASPVRTIPHLLQREETAAQIVALMLSRFDRPGPEEMNQILESARQQITGLRQLPGALLS
jgi:hypothetical protein